MKEQHNGVCLCGAVRFKVLGVFESFYLCHCSRCQKGTGSAHGANLFSSSAKLTWLAGERDVTTFKLPETRHTKCFCSKCGSPLPSVLMDGSLLVVPAGNLETPIHIKPTAHIHMASKANWEEGLASAPQYQDLS